MSSEDENQVQDKIVGAFSAVEAEETIKPYCLKDMSPTERRMLLEMNLISQNYTLYTNKVVLLDDNRTFSALINEIDHLRAASIKGGLALEKAYKKVNELDSLLEKYLDYAVSLDWGYINTEVTNIGTGMRASVMLHLPALVETALIDRAFKTIMQLGLNVKGFFGDEENSLGQMYQISNQVTLGMSEKEIREKLENITHQIVNYERKAREEMLSKQKIEVEDRVHRAYGLLTHCKTISSKEAIDLLLNLRLGAALEIIDVPMETLTALLFLTQKSHIQQLIQREELNEEPTSSDATYLDYMRAQYIQTTIRNNSGFTEGTNV
jgi:protein arginine kinase